MPANVDPYLCTHILYAFSVINSANELVTYEWDDETLYKAINDLKTTYVLVLKLMCFLKHFKVSFWNDVMFYLQQFFLTFKDTTCVMLNVYLFYSQKWQS